MIYISLGANMPSNAGPPEITLRRALDAMPARGIQIDAVSAFYLTPAWPIATEPEYVNAVARANSRLGPSALLKALLAIEKSFGRVRKTRWEPRCLDLDLLDFGGLVTDEEELSLPHPRMHERAFVLRPLLDVAPDWRHPDTGTSVAELLKIVGDEGVRPFDRVAAGT